MAGQLQFVKVGRFEMATVRVLQGCRLGGKSRAPGEICQVPASAASMAVGIGHAEPWGAPLPGVDHVEEVPAFLPNPASVAKPAEPAEVFGEEDEQEATDDAADDKAEDAAASAKAPGKRRKK